MPKFTSPPQQAQPVLVAASPSPSANGITPAVNGVITPTPIGGSYTQAENNNQAISYYPANVPNPIPVVSGRS